MASNFLIALEATAEELMEAAGIDDGAFSRPSSCGRRPTGQSTDRML